MCIGLSATSLGGTDPTRDRLVRKTTSTTMIKTSPAAAAPSAIPNVVGVAPRMVLADGLAPASVVVVVVVVVSVVVVAATVVWVWAFDVVAE